MKYILLPLITLLTSCATTVAHIGQTKADCPYIYYAGTRADAYGIGQFVTGNTKGNGLELAFILDLPLSIVADTFLFPYYLFSDHGQENQGDEKCIQK